MVSVIGRIMAASPLSPDASHGAAMLATAAQIAIGGSLHARASGREASGPIGR